MKSFFKDELCLKVMMFCAGLRGAADLVCVIDKKLTCSVSKVRRSGARNREYARTVASILSRFFKRLVPVGDAPFVLAKDFFELLSFPACQAQGSQLFQQCINHLDFLNFGLPNSWAPIARFTNMAMCTFKHDTNSCKLYRKD